LHQLGLLHLLPALVTRVIVPPSVIDELAVGREAGINLPDLKALACVVVRRPVSESALPLIADLGPGETEVLMLGLEIEDSVVFLEDGLARHVAETRGIRLTGPLGLLLDAKPKRLVERVAPLLDRLQVLRFHLAPQTRPAVLKLRGEL
jgi:uncharacterized protein